MSMQNDSRRRFLRQSALGAAVAAFPEILLARAGSIKSTATASFNPDVELEFTAQNGVANILGTGPVTRVQQYIGKVLKGPKQSLIVLPENYLGPILSLQQGQKVRAFFRNSLSEPNIIHWHGLHVPQTSDGHPMYTIEPGEQYVYEFEVLNRAGTSLYHSHAHNLTAEQVYRGLAGLIVVTDPEEQALELPRGEFDLPLVIQDRKFDQNNQLQYIHAMHERMLGFLGDQVLVNGKPNAEFSVKSRAYRFRALNGSNSRIYKLGWDDGTPLVAIGTDAGLLAKPETRPYIMMAPGERVELWLDFSGRAVGSKLVLYSLPYSGALPGMMDEMQRRNGMGMMHNPLPQGSKFPIATFTVSEKVSDSPKLPQKLVNFRRLTEKDVDNADKPLPITLAMQHMRPTLNGKSFSMDTVMDYERVALGSFKKISINHNHGMGGMKQSSEQAGEGGHGMGMMGGMMMEMAHPIHLHGQQFQILRRTPKMVKTADYNTVKDGYIDSGWKDTVLVMPGEEVEIIKPFQDYKGLFLYHCHNLEHEDLGMMRQYLVE